MNALTPIPNADEASSLGSEIDRARALVQSLGFDGDRSTAQMLEELRRAFPQSPLSVRVRALDALRRRELHSPR